MCAFFCGGWFQLYDPCRRSGQWRGGVCFLCGPYFFFMIRAAGKDEAHQRQGEEVYEFHGYGKLKRRAQRGCSRVFRRISEAVASFFVIASFH